MCFPFFWYQVSNCFTAIFLSTRIQVMEYDPSSDTIEIVHYNEKSAHNDPMNIYKYQFLLFSKATEVSTFSNLAKVYFAILSSKQYRVSEKEIFEGNTDVQEICRSL